MEYYPVVHQFSNKLYYKIIAIKNTQLGFMKEQDIQGLPQFPIIRERVAKPLLAA